MIVMKLETARINYCDIVAAIGVVVGTRVGGLRSLAEFLSVYFRSMPDVSR